MVDNAITPSETKTITEGQIRKILDLLAAALRKSDLGLSEGQIGETLERVVVELRGANFPSDPIQQVLKTQGGEMAANFVADLQRRVKAVSGFITYTVKVDRSRSPQDALQATGRKLFVNDEVAATMPQGEGDEVEITFFQVGHYISDDDLEKKLEGDCMEAIDPYTLAAFNTANPEFADTHPNCTHWKDADGKWCYAAFGRWLDGRGVFVRRNVNVWSDFWWCAARRK